MPDPNIVALAKVVKEKALKVARDGLRIGTHRIDMTVRIVGSMNVGADGTTEIRDSVDYKNAFTTVVAMFVNRCRKIGQPLTSELIADLIRISMKQDEIAASMGSTVKEIVETIERDITSVTGTKPKKGSVTTKLEVESIGLSERLRVAS